MYEISMPTIISHSVIAASAAIGFGSGKKSLKFWILSIACSVLPDADVILAQVNESLGFDLQADLFDDGA